MGKYRVLKVDPKPPFLLEYQLIAPNGRLLVEVNQYAVDSIINARDILNQESETLHAEITRLQAENAKLKALATTVWQVSVESFLDWKHNEYESLGRYLGLMSVGLGEINPEMRTSKLQSKHEARQSAIAELEALKEKKEESESDNDNS